MLLIVQQIVSQQKIKIDSQAIGDFFAQIYAAEMEEVKWWMNWEVKVDWLGEDGFSSFFYLILILS